MSATSAALAGHADTIVAVATPPGRGGVGIVRVSGAAVPAIAAALLGALPAERRAVLRDFVDAQGEPIDRGLALYFPAPRSYTGEPVLELHGHGGPVVMDLLVKRVLELGARLARPGEFSERAFLNGRLDLAQAEAVADLIDAGSAAAARAALRSLEGEFSRRVHELAGAFVELRVYVEAAIDFPDEDIEFLAAGDVAGRIDALLGRLAELKRGAEQGRLLHEGYTIVIAGRPNAGKSSLLNALAGHDAAIVTEIPGTTRDVLRERIQVDGLPLTVLDTAGLRESADPVEAEGIRRAKAAIAKADRVLFVVDAADAAAIAAVDAELAALPPGPARTVVYNKSDLVGAGAAEADAVPGAAGGAQHTGVGSSGDAAAGASRLCISARSGEGLAALRVHLKQAAGYHSDAAGAFSARRRHLEALDRAQAHAATALDRLRTGAGGELVAEELRLAHAALGEITGEVSSEDLLGRIFASFCVGK